MGRARRFYVVFFDVFNPLVVFLETVCRDTDNLDIALSKVRRTPSDFTEFSRADRGEISWVGEKDALQTG